MKGVSIGQYVPGKSFFHRIDPRLKLVFLFTIVILLLINNYLIVNVLILSTFLLLSLIARLPLKRILKSLKPLVFIMMFTFIINLFFYKDGEIIGSYEFVVNNKNVLYVSGAFLLFLLTVKLTSKFFKWFIFYAVIILLLMYHIDGSSYFSFNVDVYDEGLYNSLYVVSRFIAIVFVSTILTLSTKPTELNYALEYLFTPLKLIKVPISELSMMISISLRTIPTLLDEAYKIMNAQASRGVDFNEGKLKEKVMQIVSILVPMFIISIKRSEDLANSMEARGYIPGAKRSSIDTYRLSFIDYFSILLVLSVLSLYIWYFIL